MKRRKKERTTVPTSYYRKKKEEKQTDKPISSVCMYLHSSEKSNAVVLPKQQKTMSL